MKASRRIRGELKTYLRKGNDIPALMGDYDGNILVPNRTNYVYCRLANQEVLEVFNKRVPNLLDQQVFIGYDSREPHLLQVLDLRGGMYRYGRGDVQNAIVPPHHATHEWQNPNGGNDVVFVEGRQFMPLRPSPEGGLNVYTYQGIGWIGGAWTFLSGTSIDLSPYIPATGSYVGLVYQDTDGNAKFLSGTGDFLEDTLHLIPSDMPTPIPGTLPIAGVRLWGGQTGIYEARTTTDLIDLRFPFAHNFLLDTDTPSSYSGQANKSIFVKADETGLEFGWELHTGTAPSSATGTGYPGQMAFDDTYLYVCIGINTWKRVEMLTW